MTISHAQSMRQESSAMTEVSQAQAPRARGNTRLATALWRGPSAILIGLIKLYRLILSPWIGNQCRFHPSCSHYGEEAIRVHGAVRGSWLTLRRLSKCHPWHEGGCDPVPSHKQRS